VISICCRSSSVRWSSSLEWLVAGKLDPGLALKAYGALINGSVGSFNAIVNTLVATVPLLLAASRSASPSRPGSSTSAPRASS